MLVGLWTVTPPSRTSNAYQAGVGFRVEDAMIVIPTRPNIRMLGKHVLVQVSCPVVMRFTGQPFRVRNGSGIDGRGYCLKPRSTEHACAARLLVLSSCHLFRG